MNQKISLATQQKMLQLARQVIESKLGMKTSEKIIIDDPIMKEKRGVFVTLKKDESLRGCIGLIEGIMSLSEALPEMAQASAFEDPRFPPLIQNELPEIRIEISVLTPLQKIDDPYKIRLGIDGVVITDGYKKGVFLPQVATETGWNLEEFMGALCSEKAGLPKTAWKTKDVQIMIFQSESFCEE